MKPPTCRHVTRTIPALWLLATISSAAAQTAVCVDDDKAAADLQIQNCSAVIDATGEYLDSEDVLGGWIDETIDFRPADADAFLSRQQLFGEWQLFCKNAGEQTGTRKQFIAGLNRRKGFMPGKTTGGVRGYRGVQFKLHKSSDSGARPEFDL